MIQSMTGYGKSVLQLPTKKVTIEIKSLNSKNLDLNVRIPSYYKEKELNVVQTGTSNDIDLLKMAITMPDSLNTEREELDENEWTLINQHIDIAIKEIVQYRIDEAASLEIDFRERITNIKKYLEEVYSFDADRIENVKARLQKAIDDLKVETDQNRFEQELIYYLEKLDINEEKVRLANHLEYFLQTLETPDSNGKKLGFIVQEMGREINTTGSKANFAPMQKAVIQMKNELEQIKEQILNVL